MTVIDPRYMDVIEWTDRMAPLLEAVTTVERLTDPSQWRDWALNVLDTPALEGQNVPMPFLYDNWREWAERFNQVVDLPG